MNKYFFFKSILKQFKNKPKEERTAEEHASVRKSCYQIQKLRSLNPELRFLVDENLMETSFMKGIHPNNESVEKILKIKKDKIKQQKQKQKMKQKNKIKKTKKQKQKLKQKMK